MLISQDKIIQLLNENNIKINGAFHIGAHECEELDFYHNLGLQDEDVIWIETMPHKVNEAKNRNIPNIYNAVITDKDDDDVVFNISNNYQSSSVLDLYTHKLEHPYVHYIDKFNAKSVTINSFFERNNIDGTKYNFWNFDIQGAELLALKGSTKYI